MIKIPIVSTFNSKGFKQAEKSVGFLNKQFKSLSLSIGAALSVRRVAMFAKASIKAFAEEDKAVQALARNLQNLGLAYDVRPVEDYIRKLQYATGVADSDLRPALQQLVGATRNLATSQELLNLALDVSAGTGKSLASVTQALSRAYLGTNTSLTRLNVGLSKADLTSKSFNEITAELTARFSGQAARAAGTYAGQLAILGAAANDAQEILGEKLLKSVEMLLDEKTGVVALANTFEDMATYTGNVALGLSDIIKQVKTLGGMTGGSGFSASNILRGFPLAEISLRRLQGRGARVSAADAAKQAAIARANAKESGMLASRNYQTVKKTTNELAKQNKLKKEAKDLDAKKLDTAGKMFDDELISLEAALKNESLDRNEILRLQLKKALINENATRAEDLAKKLSESQAELAKLQSLKFTNDPFSLWMESLEKLRLGVANLANPVAPSSIFSNPTLDNISKTTPNIFTDPGFSFQVPEFNPGAIGGGINPMPQGDINIYVSGTGQLSDDTKQAVVDAVVEASGSGFATGWYRTTNRVAI